MLGKPINAKVIFVLVLALLMAWAGHTSALWVGSSQPALSGGDSAQSHAHVDGALASAACAVHYHSPLTADHLHETPYLATRLSIAAQPERTLSITSPRYFIPASPVFLIERPPRPTFVL
ncbi:MAG: hypothetical protein ACOH2I_12205 [Pseudomonas sp.]